MNLLTLLDSTEPLNPSVMQGIVFSKARLGSLGSPMQATLLNLLLRNYLAYNLYDQAGLGLNYGLGFVLLKCGYASYKYPFASSLKIFF